MSDTERESIKLVHEEEDLTTMTPEQLKAAIAKNSALAIEIGTLITFPSDVHIIRDLEMKVDFAVRVAVNLERKLMSKPSGFEVSPTDKEKDPFMPPFEPGMIVGRLDEHHRLLLNKFNVVVNHVLVTTTEMEHQFTPIRPESFVAIHRVMQALDALVFFNRGSYSGASQPHKHYQLIPRKISEDVPDLPVTKAVMEYAQENAIADGTVFEIPHFPFRNAACVSVKGFNAEELEHNYKELLKFLGMEETNENTELSYNWLSTLHWMLLVPRVKENYQEDLSAALSEMKIVDFSKSMELLRKSTKIPINSLGFAGTIFVKSATALTHVETKSPGSIISQVAAPR